MHGFMDAELQVVLQVVVMMKHYMLEQKQAQR